MATRGRKIIDHNTKLAIAAERKLAIIRTIVDDCLVLRARNATATVHMINEILNEGAAAPAPTNEE